MSRYNYKRRLARTVNVGGTGIGGENPIRLQSMTNTDTLDAGASAAQALRIAEAGGEIVRLTTQVSKIVLSLCMLLGRLEIYPILISCFLCWKSTKENPSCAEDGRIELFALSNGFF